MRWRLLLEEFGPKLTYVKGTNNIVADALSRLEISEEEFSEEAFAIELATEEDFPEDYPSSHKEIAYRQKKDRKLLKDAADHPDQHVKKPCTSERSQTQTIFSCTVSL